MADLTDYTIHGNDMQIGEIRRYPGEGVRAEVGAMIFMEDGIEIQTDIVSALHSGNRDESSSITNIGGSIIDGLFDGDKKY